MAISSSQSAVAGRMREATGDQSGVTLPRPAILPALAASARALPARTMILEGMQPLSGGGSPARRTSTPRPASTQRDRGDAPEGWVTRDPLERVNEGAVGRAARPRGRRPRTAALIALALSLWLLLAACGTANPRAGERALPSGWDAVQASARGQTVRWWLYGGDQRINAYIDRYVAPAAARLGVTLKRVPVADTADAVQRVLADRRAGRTSGGAVDLIWINGENFAAGKQAGLRSEEHTSELQSR